jgi:CO/xanthine dehydrogenase Mo-binding subunit
MGQGAETALSVATVRSLGQAATGVVLGDMTLFEGLGISPSPPSTEPGHTPKWASSVSASMTAFFHVHAVEQACHVLYRHGLLPAARDLWGTELPGDVHWEGGLLVAKGKKPLSLKALATRAHRARHVVGARVHTFFQNRFATASYPDLPGSEVLPIDALAVARGTGGKGQAPVYAPETRTAVAYPGPEVARYRRTLYASIGHLLAVEVYRSGRVQVVDAVTVLDAGDVHHQESLEGQAEGGLAMGLGMALMEELPPAPASVDGSLNLNRYFVPRVTHVPPRRHLKLRRVELEPGQSILGEDEVTPREPRRKKGIAEAAMTTVAPAVGNAIAHATGLRLRRLPFNQESVRQALDSRKGP